MKPKTLSEGDEIQLGCIIAVSSNDEEGLVKIEFNRKDITESFIKDFFYNENKKIRRQHTFAQGGVETILTSKLFILQIVICTYAV